MSSVPEFPNPAHAAQVRGASRLGRLDASTLCALGLVALLAAVSLTVRPLLPVDETRYLSVAWEMWWRGDFVLPWLNGAAYHHKPPLLFWLIHAGWAAFGVSETWPRLIGPVSAGVAILALRKLSARLWPQQAQQAGLGPLLLFGSAYLLLFQTGVMFDTLLLAALSLSWLSLHQALLGNRTGDWLLFAAAGALALLAKGPVALIYLLAPLLAWPWWRPQRSSAAVHGAQPGNTQWGGAQPASAAWNSVGRRWPWALLAVLLALLPLLAWALAASERGGEAFRQALLFGQTLDRVSGAMGHPRAGWFFLPFVLLLPFPWSLWPRAWRALRDAPGLLRDRPARFLLAPLAAGSLIHLLVSGKQVHYLIPLLALGLLLLARLLVDDAAAAARARRIAWVQGAVLALALLAASLALRPEYPINDIGARLAAAERQGQALAYIGHYQGEFHFAGRLRSPVAELAPAQAASWAAAHPQGLLLARSKRLQLIAEAKPLAEFRYKRQPLYLLAASEFIEGHAQAIDPIAAP